MERERGSSFLFLTDADGSKKKKKTMPARYLTSTQAKLILVTHTFNQVKESSVREVFEGLHSAYIDAVSNPFYTPGKKIESKSFEGRVDRIITSTART